jgi:hypothetical protein
VILPEILHFNGPQKQNMMAVASQTRWTQLDPTAVWESEIYSVSSGARMMLKEACALYMPKLACGNTFGECLKVKFKSTTIFWNCNKKSGVAIDSQTNIFVADVGKMPYCKIQQWLEFYQEGDIGFVVEQASVLKHTIPSCAWISVGGGMGGRRDGWVVCVMGGFAEWVDGVMGLRVGFININDMYNNDVGKGVVYAYEAYEVK